MNRSLFYLLASLLSGILLFIGWPTNGLPFLLFGAFVPLLLVEWRIRTETGHRRALRIFGWSYLTFFIWNLCTSWWLLYSSVFGGCFVIIVNSLLMSIVFGLYHWVSCRKPILSTIFLIAVFISFEKFHLNWELSWPWLNLGNAFSEYVTWIQWYEYTGTFGGSLWILIVNVMLFKAIVSYRLYRDRHRLKVQILRAMIVITLPIVISLTMYYRYQEIPRPVRVLLLQPNIDPYEEKYSLSNNQMLDSLFSLVNKKTLSQTDIIVAPETVFSQHMNVINFSDSYLIFKLKRVLLPYPHVTFLSGISLYKEVNIPNRYTAYFRNKKVNIFNSAFAYNAHHPIAFYHKSKPVAGVESFPYKNLLQPIFGDTIINLGGVTADITPQQNRSIFSNDEGTLQMAPIICYESVYGEFVTDYVKKGAQLLTIMTNDAWWGDTQGHKQLLSYARLRAIETRRSITRSANTGISAFINQRGDITGSLPYGNKGSISGVVNANDTITFYTHYGNMIARIAVMLVIMIILSVIAGSFIKSKPSRFIE